VCPWVIFLCEINLKNNTVLGISIFGRETMCFSLVAGSTGEAWEETDGVKTIVFLSDVFRTDNTSPNWNLSLLISQILLFTV
jgi:hypothetical protein